MLPGAVNASGDAPTKPHSGAQSAGRALAVLDCFADGAPDRGVTEIARLVGLRVSTVHRLVQALVAHGYLERNGSTDRYRLGPAITALARAQFRASGLDRVKARMDSLSDLTGESVTLGVREASEIALVLQSNATAQALRYEEPPGLRAPLNCSAIGKAILSHEQPTREIVRDARPFVTVTDRSLTTEAALLADLQAAHERGWALLDEERVPGVRAIGAAVPSDIGVPRVGLSVQGPVVRFADERLPELAAHLREAAADIAQLLPPGWP